jgi:hypothetical protein
MDSIQIEITNACMNSCSNCTRFCGHTIPFFLTFDQFRNAIDSLLEFPGIVGFMGGEPLLHPEFEKFCEYALSKIERNNLGLWTSFPQGRENYREIICKTFGNVYLNDHTRKDIFHCPVLVAIEEIEPDPQKMFLHIDHCWVQRDWSASINPKGAFFCEIAASMSILFDGNSGWKVEPGWWTRIPKDYREQVEEYCPKCGCASTTRFDDGTEIGLPRRQSIDGRDDISIGNLKRLEGKSLKIKQGKYVLSDLVGMDPPQKMWLYRDHEYRKSIAKRYGIELTINENEFHEPHLQENFIKKKPLWEQYREKYGGTK